MVKTAPAHAPYKQLIAEAIAELKERSGSSLPAICKVIGERKPAPDSHGLEVVCPTSRGAGLANHAREVPAATLNPGSKPPGPPRRRPLSFLLPRRLRRDVPRRASAARQVSGAPGLRPALLLLSASTLHLPLATGAEQKHGATLKDGVTTWKKQVGRQPPLHRSTHHHARSHAPLSPCSPCPAPLGHFQRSREAVGRVQGLHRGPCSPPRRDCAIALPRQHADDRVVPALPCAGVWPDQAAGGQGRAGEGQEQLQAGKSRSKRAAQQLPTTRPTPPRDQAAARPQTHAASPAPACPAPAPPSPSASLTHPGLHLSLSACQLCDRGCPKCHPAVVPPG